MLHSTEATIPRADSSQNEKRRCPFGKTFPKVRAAGLFTDGVEPCRIQDRLHFHKIFKGRDPFLQPRRFIQSLCLLLWVTFPENSKSQIIPKLQIQMTETVLFRF